MKVLIHASRQFAIDAAAALIARAISRQPAIVLGLATGHTAIEIYRRLGDEFAAGRLSFRDVTTFNLDEYVGLGPQHPNSFRHFMDRRLFDRIDIDQACVHVPRGDTQDDEAEAGRYDRAIAAAGGIDLQLLGIGENGHIGFNEPISSLGSRTRVKTLTDATRRANSRDFASPAEVPRRAITMGIANILEAREILVVALGAAKAPAVAAMIEGPVSASCPASVLQMHRFVTVMLDAEAARALRHTDYYTAVHPGGADV